MTPPDGTALCWRLTFLKAIVAPCAVITALVESTRHSAMPFLFAHDGAEIQTKMERMSADKPLRFLSSLQAAAWINTIYLIVL